MITRTETRTWWQRFRKYKQYRVTNPQGDSLLLFAKDVAHVRRRCRKEIIKQLSGPFPLMYDPVQVESVLIRLTITEVAQ